MLLSVSTIRVGSLQNLFNLLCMKSVIQYMCHYKLTIFIMQFIHFNDFLKLIGIFKDSPYLKIPCN